jgi:hypothetical protein
MNLPCPSSKQANDGSTDALKRCSCDASNQPMTSDNTCHGSLERPLLIGYDYKHKE